MCQNLNQADTKFISDFFLNIIFFYFFRCNFLIKLTLYDFAGLFYELISLDKKKFDKYYFLKEKIICFPIFKEWYLK